MNEKDGPKIRANLVNIFGEEMAKKLFCGENKIENLSEPMKKVFNVWFEIERGDTSAGEEEEYWESDGEEEEDNDDRVKICATDMRNVSGLENDMQIMGAKEGSSGQYPV